MAYLVNHDYTKEQLIELANLLGVSVKETKQFIKEVRKI